MSARIGIDLGGTKTEILLMSANNETALRKRLPTPSHDYEAILQTIAALVKEAQMLSGPVSHIGIGMPGAADRNTGLIKNANTTCLIGKPFAQDLRTLLGCDVRLENDANCFVLSEATDGAGADASVVFGAILGTGVGGGLTINGQLHLGLHDIAGEWGHNPVPLRTSADNEPWHHPFTNLGRPCYCGKLDCVETHLCGAGLRRTWLSVLNKHDPSITTAPALPILSTLIEESDPIALRTLDLYAQQLACSLATIINVIDPDVIVLGGGLSNLPGLCAAVKAALPAHVFNDRADTAIKKAVHSDSSGVRGAAWL